LRSGSDVVVIPAEDGGYVLIGSRRPQPELFAPMAWGTDTVMAETRARLARSGLTWRELPTLWDVDRPEDLARLHDVWFVIERSPKGDGTTRYPILRRILAWIASLRSQ